MKLLRAIKEEHPNAQVGTWVAPYNAAYDAGLDPDTPFYRRAIDYLVDEGALVWAEQTANLQTNPIYRITQRGMEMLAEA